MSHFCSLPYLLPGRMQYKLGLCDSLLATSLDSPTSRAARKSSLYPCHYKQREPISSIASSTARAQYIRRL
jgi:hypothetical protein